MISKRILISQCQREWQEIEANYACTVKTQSPVRYFFTINRYAKIYRANICTCL